MSIVVECSSDEDYTSPHSSSSSCEHIDEFNKHCLQVEVKGYQLQPR